MSIAFGNLTIEEMERRLGINLTTPERAQLIAIRQDITRDLGPEKIHIFDSPFTICCGSVETAHKVMEILSPYSEQMACKIGVSLQGAMV